MSKTLGILCLLIGFAMALPAPPSVPEIDPASGYSAVMLLGGALLILRGRG